MRTRPLLATLALLALTGCTNAATITSPQTALWEADIKPANEVNHDATEIVNDAFSISPEVHDAQQKAAAQCMEERGYTWEPVPAQPTYDVRNSLHPNPLTVEQAKRYGYGPTTPDYERLLPPIEQEAFEAYMGTDLSNPITSPQGGGSIAPDGCLAESYKQVFGSAEAAVYLEGGAENLPLPYIAAIHDNIEDIKVTEAWSACMADNYDIKAETPSLAAHSNGIDQYDMAVKDATCREETGFEDVMNKLLDAYMTTFINDNEDLIKQAKEYKETAEANAKKF